mmetsp:Transcript_8992/g.15860  ORF Transcript_8992/g.15860 Transcript_8992/m.15860 type:complete len:211 (-) Transcript_8992:86-718(-)|eukprot:CAMPEP_0197653822 /NCGR_PEP_ID=MMETSP1338-20131121/37316_1 /TAXON_ID=43686 ORGANISM="Pelagodinium beii, Strain RCC1491" /NCGR_SAMPLE_ID=MMETSP1338 /ASSEMBLY_ACC=CAM_ASM_000754 /LENGTH=210 /DNA_ID=CAMNT_0043229077 /DNA_START=59 /DNA_END=691 /DNA_ORIENTATION=+
MAEELEDGWEKRESRKEPGVFYYVHPETGKTQREAPLRNKRRKVAPWPTLPGQAPPKLSSVGVGGLFDDLPEAVVETADAKKPESIPEVKKHLASVKCLHLLKKHAGSRRPSSWREKVITRSLEEATYQLKELRKTIAAKQNAKEIQSEFERLARRESDCSSAAKGGSLGKFGRGKMQPAFETAAFALDVNELSSVVTTDSGLHIILRIE